MKVKALLMAGLLSACQSVPSVEPTAEWKLTFSDEFDGVGKPDPANYPDQYIIDYVRVWSK